MRCSRWLQIMRLLLVEDHASSREALAKLLKQMGYDVTAACTFREALDFCAEKRFAVLLSDIDLPDGNGCDLVIEIRKRYPLQKAVALTATEGDDHCARGFLSGFDRYLSKPVDLADLRRALPIQGTRRIWLGNTSTSPPRA